MALNPDLRLQSIKLLANGFKFDFAKFVLENDRYNELIMELADQFIEENIPVQGEQNRTDLAFEIVELNHYGPL